MEELKTYFPYFVVIFCILNVIYQAYKNRHNEEDKGKPFYLKSGLKPTIINSIILLIFAFSISFVFDWLTNK